MSTVESNETCNKELRISIPKAKRLNILPLDINLKKIEKEIPCKTPVIKSTSNKIKIQKDEFDNNNQNLNVNKNINFEELSFEEIENDFNLIKHKSEILKVENELFNILRGSTKSTSLDEDYKIEKVERSQNPLFNNKE